MRVEIGYNLNSLEKCAQFIWDHNPHVPNWIQAPKDVFGLMMQIKENVSRDVQRNVNVLLRERKGEDLTKDGWINMTGTGGYTILYSLEVDTVDYIYISVDFVVNPAVGDKDPTYVSEEIDISKNIV
jgi:hypothetical protein